jgi:hypothetical protein
MTLSVVFPQEAATPEWAYSDGLMNRRTFIHSAGAAAGLSLGGRLGMAGTGATVPPLLQMLEDSPRERLPGELVRMIRTGLPHEDLTTALFLATTRNVQPYPDVGFKYHSVMMLRSIYLTEQHAPPAEKWLPAIWAADYFKDTQAQERASSGWHMSQRAPSSDANPERARRSLAAALDKWDHEAADAAIIDYAQSASLDDIFQLLFPYGARDLREIGHKAITVCNAHGLLTLLGGTPLAPVLRSTVAALVNSEGQPDPATHDLTPDRPWRRNRERLHQIPPSWKQGHDDPGARTELRAALYRSSAQEAGGVVVTLLQRGISPDAIWQVMFDTAAELLMHEPGIVSLHAQTTANALHYAYRVCGNEQTQQLTLLQCAAFVAMFREMTRTKETDLNLQKLEPLPLERKPEEALEEIFSELSARNRLQAARKSLSYLRNGGDADKLIATARHHLVYGAQEAHDYKFTEAVFDNLAQFSDPDWRARFLSAGMAYFKAPRKQPVPVVSETLKLLA